jgi:superfamily II DNA or RNA helicase
MVTACKKARFRTRPRATERDLVAVARKLYNDPDLQLRRPGQRDAMLAAMGTHAAEQVVVVLATGTGKTLIVMAAAALEGARTTILILPAVALRTNMMERFGEVGVEARLWAPGESKAAPLVVVSAEAACTRSFLDYAHRLEGQQRLDRIVIDECHLTVTATYRKSMMQLGSFVRQIRTQSVWLTATLPPAFEEAFIRRNLLVRPRMVRESTNRANIRYSIRRYEGPGGLCGRVAELVRTLLEGGSSSDGKAISVGGGGDEARMIVYCPTLTLLGELAKELDCPMYTGDQDTMGEEEKEMVLGQWLGPVGSPVIVATSALGVGFDYPHVRWVVHAGAPRRITDFSQESGRAGRDGRQAESIILLSGAWRPNAPADGDEESMQLYLTEQHCLRAVMSQFLDQAQDWRWCMEEEDELCGACPQHRTERRPPGLLLYRRAPSTAVTDGADIGPARARGGWDAGDSEMDYTGPDEVLRRARLDDEVVRRFEANLEATRGCCLLCRVEGGRPFDHGAGGCSRRWAWIRAKKGTMRACEAEGKPWMAKFTACFVCYLPQTICSRADPEARVEAEVKGDGEACRFRDMIMPLCHGAFFRTGPRALLKKHFSRPFRDTNDYMRWLGEATELGSTPCIQAIRVAEMLLVELQ